MYLGAFTYKLEPAGTLPSATKAMFYLENIDSEVGRIMVLRRKTANGQSVTTNFTTAFSVNDHLGSTRAVMDAAGNILERNAYYPFGLQTDQGNAFPDMTTTLPSLYPRYIIPSLARRDLYNGKEIQTVAGKDYLDYGFRQYDPVTARWMAVDPKADSYLLVTPYIFCLGSPIVLFDLAGDAIYVREYVPSQNDDINGEYLTYKYNLFKNRFEDKNGNAYMGNNPEILQILEALNIIALGHDGNQLLYSLSHSEKSVLIQISPLSLQKKGRGSFEDKSSEFTSAVTWNPNDLRTVHKKSYNYISLNDFYGVCMYAENIPFIIVREDLSDAYTQRFTLAHELGHSRDRFWGLIDDDKDIWFITKDGDPVITAEISATHTENLIRKEHGINLRTHYVYNTLNEPDEGEIVDSSGRSLYYDVSGKRRRNHIIINTNERYKY